MSKKVQSFITSEEDSRKPGAIQFVTRAMAGAEPGPVVGLNHACPCGCGKKSFVRLNPEYWEAGTKPMWTREGDDLHMTLAPSIGIKPLENGKYHWHGFLRNGVFEEC
jgi:hypothetical protein